MAILYDVSGAPSRACTKELPKLSTSVFCAQTNTLDIRVRIRKTSIFLTNLTFVQVQKKIEDFIFFCLLLISNRKVIKFSPKNSIFGPEFTPPPEFFASYKAHEFILSGFGLYQIELKTA
jgi:hypothetical protein